LAFPRLSDRPVLRLIFIIIIRRRRHFLNEALTLSLYGF
jgi:hypothetical protein